MTFGKIEPRQLPAVREMSPNSIYWQLQKGAGQAFGLQDRTGKVQAVLAADLQGDRIELMWLWVSPSRRCQGWGTMLLMQLLSSGAALGARTLEAAFPAAEAYIGIEALFLRIPGENVPDDGFVLRTTLGRVDMQRLPADPQRECGIALAQADPVQRKAASACLRAQGMAVGTALAEGLCDTVLSRLLWRDGALALVESGNVLCLSWLWCEDGWSHILPGLLAGCFHSAAALYPPETPLYTAAVSPAALRLCRALLPQAEQSPMIRYRLAIG